MTQKFGNPNYVKPVDFIQEVAVQFTSETLAMLVKESENSNFVVVDTISFCNRNGIVLSEKAVSELSVYANPIFSPIFNQIVNRAFLHTLK